MNCKWNKTKQTRHIRLRGGADSNLEFDHGSLTTVTKRGIANAKSHGINMQGGVMNNGDGNCAFEAVIDSISMRSCFNQTLDGDPDFWRKTWLREVENVAYDRWNDGLSIDQWKAEWKVLQETRTYECKLGDLIVPGIAHCVKKDILIFNTSPKAHDPIYVVEASTIGGQAASTEIPICLAYNQSHYEIMVPTSHEDIVKTVNLKKDYILGRYKKKIQDIQVLKSQLNEEKSSYAGVVNASKILVTNKTKLDVVSKSLPI